MVPSECREGHPQGGLHKDTELSSAWHCCDVPQPLKNLKDKHLFKNNIMLISQKGRRDSIDNSTTDSSTSMYLRQNQGAMM